MQQKAGVFRVLPETLSDELYGIGFKKGNIKLRKAVDKALDELYSDGSRDEEEYDAETEYRQEIAGRRNLPDSETERRRQIGRASCRERV